MAEVLKMSKDGKLFTCPNEGCRKSFKWPIQVARHKDKCVFPPPQPIIKPKMYTIEDERFVCNTCHRSYSKKVNVYRHIRKGCVRKEKKVFKCTQCNKEFLYECCLNKHLANHSIAKTCFCGKEFRQVDHFSSNQIVCPYSNIENSADFTASFVNIDQLVPNTELDALESNDQNSTVAALDLDFAEIQIESEEPTVDSLDLELAEIQNRDSFSTSPAFISPCVSNLTSAIATTSTPARATNYWKNYRDYKGKKVNWRVLPPPCLLRQKRKCYVKLSQMKFCLSQQSKT